MIAAVEGYALAGGCELALSADIVIAARDARFGLPEVKRGLVAGAGGLLRLPKTVPYGRAMLIALTGDPVTAPQAYECGLVTEMTEPGRALERAVDLARRIAENGPLAVRATKRILANAAGWTDTEGFRYQRGIVEGVMASADAVEGARAFSEKRNPRWAGR